MRNISLEGFIPIMSVEEGTVTRPERASLMNISSEAEHAEYGTTNIGEASRKLMSLVRIL